MRAMIFTIAGFLFLLALNGCATAPAGSGERQALLAADTAFSQMSQAHGAAEAFYAFMSPDATSLPAGETPVRGREAIRQSMLDVKGSLSWHPVAADVAGSRDLGYTWGLFEYQSKDANGQTKDRTVNMSRSGNASQMGAGKRCWIAATRARRLGELRAKVTGQLRGNDGAPAVLGPQRPRTPFA